jgi:hypothetical protein
MNLTLAVRALALLGAPWIAFSVLTQGALSTQTVLADGGTWARGVWQYLCYFTVLTNIFVVLVLARAAWKPSDRRGLNAPPVELMAVTSIVFVGAVYNILLASLWDPQGLRKYNDDVLHIGAPILFVMFWLLRPRGELSWRDGLFAALWPFGYAIYGLTRGAVDGFYPYFFMNPAEMSWPSILVNMTGLVSAFLVAALLLVGLDRTAFKLQPKI